MSPGRRQVGGQTAASPPLLRAVVLDAKLVQQTLRLLELAVDAVLKAVGWENENKSQSYKNILMKNILTEELKKMLISHNISVVFRFRSQTVFTF